MFDTRKLKPLTLEQHQQILYEILYMVDDFCKANDIPYFLVGGSLLGAVRHQGIIPWDDDVDIAMTRENYEQFLKLFKANVVDGYELLDFEHTEGYLLPFAKMTKKNSWTRVSETNRIHIDIFVYDGCGDDLDEAQKYFRRISKKFRRFATCFIHCTPFSKIYDCWKAKVVYFATQFPKEFLHYSLLKIFPFLRKRFIRKCCKDCARLSVSSSKYCANIGWGLYGVGEVQLTTSFVFLDKMKFGDRELPVPSGWHEYLIGIYGDYMELPPENKRRRHLDGGSWLIVG